MPKSIGDVAPRGADWVPRKLKELEDRIKRMETAKIGNRMTVDGEPGIIITGGGGIEISDGGGLKVNDGGDIDLVHGDLTASGGELRSGNFDPGTAGWRLLPGGNAEFNNITLRGGIIGDDALENPVLGKVAHDANTGFAVTTTDTTHASAVVTVPSGFTSALVSATAVCNARNTRGVQDSLNGYAEIEGAGWFSVISDGAPGYTAAFAACTTALLTGLSGSFHVRAHMWTGGGTWTADLVNGASIDALVLFLR